PTSHISSASPEARAGCRYRRHRYSARTCEMCCRLNWPRNSHALCKGRPNRAKPKLSSTTFQLTDKHDIPRRVLPPPVTVSFWQLWRTLPTEGRWNRRCGKEKKSCPEVMLRFGNWPGD